MPKFIVVSPQPTYIEHIGGVTVAHTLAHKLQLAGEEVYLYADSTNPKYNIKCIPHGSIFDLDQDNTIVILIAGAGDHTFLPNIPTFLIEAKHVVRWQVNHQTKEYPKHNKFYKFHTYWDTYDTQKIDGQLSVIEIHDDVFYNKGLERTGNCFLEKGNLDEQIERMVHHPNDICIDRYLYTMPDNKKIHFLSDLFNRCKLFISYTPLTFCSVLASMCGCVSIVIPKKNFDKEKWRSEIWCAKYGTGVGIEEMDWSMKTLPLVPSMIDEYVNIEQPRQINQFIKDCYQWTKETQ